MSTKKPSRLPTKIQYANLPQYRVNLDAPAQTRWNHVINQYRNELDKAWQIMDKFLFDLAPHPIFIYIVKWICSFLIYIRLFPHSNELIGIAKYVRHKLYTSKPS